MKETDKVYARFLSPKGWRFYANMYDENQIISKALYLDSNTGVSPIDHSVENMHYYTDNMKKYNVRAYVKMKNYTKFMNNFKQL